ncbi:hypothetical protein HZA57_05480 [Candidatus Poribacteria bacterium]|nr:hypothetical protein [Candidatus Poribacteria bacterium]
MTEPGADRVCENCGRWIEPDEVLYRVRVEVFAEPRVPEVSLEKSRSELASDWEELIRKLEQMNEDQVREATDQVYESYGYNLCGACRQELHRRIRRRSDLL